jgi:hypothetical protein
MLLKNDRNLRAFLAERQKVPENQEHAVFLRGFWPLFLLILGLALASCGSSFICRGCVENAVPGHVDYHYQYFDGPYTRNVNADAGQILTMKYTATVEEGTLEMRVVSPSKQVVWQETFDTGANVSGSGGIDIQQSGRYQLVVEGHQTSGSFQIDWELN